MQFSLKRKMVFSVVLAIAFTSVILLFMGYKIFQSKSWRATESESRNTLNAHAKGSSDWFYDKKQAVHGLKQQVQLNPSLDIVPYLRQTLASGGFGLVITVIKTAKCSVMILPSIKQGMTQEFVVGIKRR